VAAGLGSTYRACAIMVLNLVLVVVLVNLAAAYYLGGEDSASRSIRLKSGSRARVPYTDEMLAALYPDMTREEVAQLITETWPEVLVHEPYTQFRRRTQEGVYVNQTEHGFRRSKDQGPWPPDVNDYTVFLFGGSTVFNMGVPDDETIASHLQAVLREVTGLPVRVYNFGQPWYFSSQERVLFERLLLHGHVPDMAVFIDGLNDFGTVPDEPAFTKRLANVYEWNNAAPSEVWGRALASLPAVQAWQQFQSEPTSEPQEPQKNYGDPAVLNAILDRYLANQRMIRAVARAHGVGVAFVWQPVPLYRFEKGEHPYGLPAHLDRARFGYPLFAERLAREPLGADFVWCADIHADSTELLYVDYVHYSPKLSRMLAESIGAALVERVLLVPAEVMVGKQADAS
jgi:hypothetical protein